MTLEAHNFLDNRVRELNKASLESLYVFLSIFDLIRLLCGTGMTHEAHQKKMKISVLGVASPPPVTKLFLITGHHMEIGARNGD